MFPSTAIIMTHTRNRVQMASYYNIIQFCLGSNSISISIVFRFFPPTGRRSRTQRPEFLKDWQPEISRFLCGLKYPSLFRVSSCQKGLTSKKKKCPQNNKTRVVWHARAFESPAPFSSKKKNERNTINTIN